MKRVHLAIVAPTLGMGGAERCVATLLRHFDRRRFRLSLVLIFEGEIFYHLPPDVQVHVLGDRSPTRLARLNSSVKLPDSLAHAQPDLEWMETTAARLGAVLRRLRPDVVLARHIYASLLCALDEERQSRLILSVDNHMSTMLPRIEHGPLYAFLLQELFNRGDRVVALCQGLADDLIACFGVDPGRIAVIPNPVDLKEVETLVPEPVQHPWFNGEHQVVLSVGRLVEQKGFDILIRAVGILHLRGLCPKLVLVGDGPEKQRLTDMARAEGLAEHFWLAGPQPNPFAYLARSTVFALSSLHEGFANVVIEAMASGCPVVSADCPSGPDEILEGGAHGLLVKPGDPAELATGLERVLTDPGLRALLREKGLLRAAHFDAPHIARRYEEAALRS